MFFEYQTKIVFKFFTERIHSIYLKSELANN